MPVCGRSCLPFCLSFFTYWSFNLPPRNRYEADQASSLSGMNAQHNATLSSLRAALAEKEKVTNDAKAAAAEAARRADAAAHEVRALREECAALEKSTNDRLERWVWGSVLVWSCHKLSKVCQKHCGYCAFGIGRCSRCLRSWSGGCGGPYEQGFLTGYGAARWI